MKILIEGAFGHNNQESHKENAQTVAASAEDVGDKIGEGSNAWGKLLAPDTQGE